MISIYSYEKHKNNPSNHCEPCSQPFHCFLYECERLWTHPHSRRNISQEAIGIYLTPTDLPSSSTKSHSSPSVLSRSNPRFVSSIHLPLASYAAPYHRPRLLPPSSPPSICLPQPLSRSHTPPGSSSPSTVGLRLDPPPSRSRHAPANLGHLDPIRRRSRSLHCWRGVTDRRCSVGFPTDGSGILVEHIVIGRTRLIELADSDPHWNRIPNFRVGFRIGLMRKTGFLSSSVSWNIFARREFSAMVGGSLGSLLLRRSKTLTLISHLRGSPSRVSNGHSLLSSSSGFALSSRCGESPLSRFSSLCGFKSLPKSLLGSCARKMTTSAALLNSTKAEITNSGLKLLVAEGPHAQKMVGIWLFGCAAWVFSMVVLGGVTRLTRSGLSMTDWKFTGSLPPLIEEEWLLEFKKYQQSPEYQRVNKGMSMEDFKFIYWMEYAHRMWGRGLGVVFALPFTYFLAKGFITRQLGLRLSALFALGAGQGLIGWWMVKSGLEEPASEYVQPRVSPYRLATHLISALVIYSGILWTALSVVMPEPPNGSIGWVHGAAKVRKMALPVSLLVGITALSGAFVAGNDAGHAFNTFPKMGDSWIPDDIFSMEPLIRNFFENTSMVQLNHRILATTTLISVGSLWLASRKIEMHPAVKSLIGSTLGMAALQVTLGISTLLSYVPVSLGSAHQAGALTLLSLVILLTHTVRKPSPAVLKSLASLPKIKC